MLLEDRKKREKSTISVLLNGDLINKGTAANTFGYVVNYISNIVGKEILSNDFPQIFNPQIQTPSFLQTLWPLPICPS
jgi:hypothetical protein